MGGSLGLIHPGGASVIANPQQLIMGGFWRRGSDDPNSFLGTVDTGTGWAILLKKLQSLGATRGIMGCLPFYCHQAAISEASNVQSAIFGPERFQEVRQWHSSVFVGAIKSPSCHTNEWRVQSQPNGEVWSMWWRWAQTTRPKLKRGWTRRMSNRGFGYGRF